MQLLASHLFEEEITVTYALCHGPNPVGLVEIRYVKGALSDSAVSQQCSFLDAVTSPSVTSLSKPAFNLDYVKRKPLGDADAVVVSVVEGNEVALKLYERFGFQIIGRDEYEHIA